MFIKIKEEEATSMKKQAKRPSWEPVELLVWRLVVDCQNENTALQMSIIVPV